MRHHVIFIRPHETQQSWNQYVKWTDWNWCPIICNITLLITFHHILIFARTNAWDHQASSCMRNYFISTIISMSRLHTEPGRWSSLASWLTSCPDSHPLLATTLGITADIVVFGYPIFLVLWYLWDGWTNHTSNPEHKKNQALTIFMSVLCSVCLTMIVQLFATKQRPIRSITDTNYTESILHDFLPTASFPSDHAAVSFAFAFGCLVLGFQSKHKTLQRWWYRWFMGAIITSISRVAIHLHRPTDIIGWFVSALWWTILIISLHPWLSTRIYPSLHTVWAYCVNWVKTKIVQPKQ